MSEEQALSGIPQSVAGVSLWHVSLTAYGANAGMSQTPMGGLMEVHLDR